MITTNIRFASEKQIALIIKLATIEQFGCERPTYMRCGFKYSAGTPCSGFEELDLSKLTMSAASDIISNALDFIHNLGSFTKDSCDEMDCRFNAYINELKKCKYGFVPKVELNFDENGDYKYLFEYGDAEPLIEDFDEMVKMAEESLEFSRNCEIEDFDGGEDWYREGSGAYYEDRLEVGMCAIGF